MSILQEQRKVRVRYAPSPTGPQHIGGIRTAVYNYFFAKRMGGTFILRIEDTDEKRFVEGSEAYLKEALSWMSITPDEGPDQGEHMVLIDNRKESICIKNMLKSL